jgi:transposase InsO family protein
MIWVIVDRLTRGTHFLAVKQKDNCEKLAKIYVNEIVSKHGVPKIIVSDRGSVFTSVFWKHLRSSLGSKLDLSTAYHPQTRGQIERTNQILEDMLRACVLDFGTAWNEYLLTRVNSINVLDEGLRIGEIGRWMNSKVNSIKQGVYRK